MSTPENRPEQDWSLPEKHSRLNITAPPDWNEYDAYLLDGGHLEYEEWKAQKAAIATSEAGGDR